MASEAIHTLVRMLRDDPPLQGGDVLEMRAHLDSLTAAVELPTDIRLEPVDAGGVASEWTSVEGAAGPRTLLYLHGGGYGIGSVASHRQLVGEIARAADARALSVGYRLAPEHPFPAAVEDAVAAYRFLLASGCAPQQVAVAGDSAGGGLAVALLLALRDAGEALPATAVCLSPWLDLSLSGESVSSKADADPLADATSLGAMAAAYLGDTDPRRPLASPLFGDLSGLPPLLIQVGTEEILLDDSRRFADRASAAGVHVELETWEEMIHVWHSFLLVLPEARQAIERIGAWLRERVSAGPTKEER